VKKLLVLAILVSFLKVSTYADGKQTDTSFNSLTGYGDKKAAGEVKITSVTDSAR
jgi:hypothetical protein